MITLKISWSELKTKSGIMKYRTAYSTYYIIVQDDFMEYYCEIPFVETPAEGSCQKDFEDNYKTKADKNNKSEKGSSLNGVQLVTPIKSFLEKTSSRASVDFCDKRTWHYDAAASANEVLTTSDNTVYTAAHQNVIELRRCTERALMPQYAVTVKKNDVAVTTGFTVNYTNGTVTFSSANQPEDVIKMSYYYAQTSKYEFTPPSGKCWLMNHIEAQFSAGAVFNDTLVFEMILNPNPWTGANDYTIGAGEYMTAADFMNKSNEGVVLEPFGELTQKVNVLPWSYLSGIKFVPRGVTADFNNNEFNGIRLRLKNNSPYTNCELATATFYFYERNN